VRVHVRAFCEAAVAAFEPDDPIVEFGSFQTAGQTDLANLRPLFPGARYIGCGARPGRGVDRVEDMAACTLPTGCAGTVVCLDTLEHVFRIHDACGEIYRILRPGGLAILAVPMRFPIHDQPSDYWRLTPECLSRLLKPFALRVIGSQGTEAFPHTVFGAAVKAPAPAEARERAQRLIDEYERWLKTTAAARPVAERVRHVLKASYRSTGERRELTHEAVARFTITPATGAREV
jgi:SAM-dependent methyltransferase